MSVSDGHMVMWESGHLTTAPTRTKRTAPDEERTTSHDDRRRQQSAAGTDDDFCHVIVAGPPFRYTLCGQRLKPPQLEGHKLGKCPNGIPVCPECARIRGKES